MANPPLLAVRAQVAQERLDAAAAWAASNLGPDADAEAAASPSLQQQPSSHAAVRDLASRDVRASTSGHAPGPTRKQYHHSTGVEPVSVGVRTARVMRRQHGKPPPEASAPAVSPEGSENHADDPQQPHPHASLQTPAQQRLVDRLQHRQHRAAARSSAQASMLGNEHAIRLDPATSAPVMHAGLVGHRRQAHTGHLQLRAVVKGASCSGSFGSPALAGSQGSASLQQRSVWCCAHASCAWPHKHCMDLSGCSSRCKCCNGAKTDVYAMVFQTGRNTVW